MAREYSVQTCQVLAEEFRRAGIIRPMRIQRYDPGTELKYEVTGVWPAARATVRLRVEKFVGGGFAGQVYRATVLAAEGEPIAGLTVGGLYAVKILVPPSGFGRKFRDGLYKLAYGAPFSLQSLPAALRAGSLWQKFIRRACRERFGDERAVADVLGTFVDGAIGSCGEVREWIEGRQWRFEVDDRLDARWRWRPGRPETPGLGSPEYRAKRAFMDELVRLMHEMGAGELARQYEWWTCKSQPNVLKRQECEDYPARGLTAVDFRAGLTLLPFLPMSPADVRLIAAGLVRGKFVQFDRGDLKRLDRYVADRPEEFADMRGALDELAAAERQYRDSLPDLTHHHMRLLYDRRLWGGICDGAVVSWRVRNTTDEGATWRLRNSRLLTLAFMLLGLVPLAGVVAAAALVIVKLIGRQFNWHVLAAALLLGVAAPLVAKFLRRIWGRGDLRRHYARLLVSPRYFLRTLHARAAEKLIVWHRAGRVGAERALRLVNTPVRFAGHFVLSALPAGMHRFLTDGGYAWNAVKYVVSRPLRLYFDPQEREKWLCDMVEDGHRHGMLTDDDKQHILGQVKEPFIQKYLKNLAVHICLAPTTHVVAGIIALVYIFQHPEHSWAENAAAAGLILAFFQVIPISPGSLARGLYVLYLMIRERKFKDYNVAVFLAFFKYVGYLAFPVQMAYRYPALARFMAGHWATGAARVVPVFGEHGALLEHSVFDLFYNYLLTVRRRINLRAERRRGLPANCWSAASVMPAAALLAGADLAVLTWTGATPTLGLTWPLAVVPVFALGWLTARRAGGMSLARRILLATSVGALAGAIQAAWNSCLWLYLGGQWFQFAPFGERLGEALLWHVFCFALIALLGASTGETRSVPEE